jgi:hypothetical protein
MIAIDPELKTTLDRIAWFLHAKSRSKSAWLPIQNQTSVLPSRAAMAR